LEQDLDMNINKIAEFIPFSSSNNEQNLVCLVRFQTLQ
jgi:hypothetical protein